MSVRRLVVLVRREALATLRDPFTVTILVLVPLMALLLFGKIMSTKVSGLELGVIDGSRSAPSRRLVTELEAQGSFIARAFATRAEMDRAMLAGEIGAGIIVPPDFERDLRAYERGGAAPEIRVVYDGGEVVLAGNTEAFLSGFTTATGLALRAADGPSAPVTAPGARPAGVTVLTTALFNPSLDGTPYMVSGTFGFVLSFATTLIIAVSIVNERFSGTFEQLQVTPATSVEILLGKILPLGAVFSADVVLMMLLAGFLLGVWPAGSALLFIVISTVYLLVSLSMGVIFSATSKTAAEAVSKTVLASQPLILLSGFAVPSRNMPLPFRVISELIPATHYIRVSRAIYLRGEGPIVLLPEILIILAMGGALATVALRAIARRQ
ncbi:ABC transporter permease [Candidatus Binatia bacterium]|jgi:ABC-2 type transport system permease protein|nr:ABC transporter permease [Candidatus Binatia bacterium]